MRRPMRLTVRVRRALLLTGVLLLGAVGARAQTAKGAKVDPAWLRTDAASKTVEFKLVAGLTEANGGMNFNGFGRGGLVLTVPRGWTVVLHFKNEDPNLPHSVEVIPDAAPMTSLRGGHPRCSTDARRSGDSGVRARDDRSS